MLKSRYASLIVLILVIVSVPLISANSYHLRLAGVIWCTAIAVVGLNILMGETGLVSLGHAAFVGIGSYAVAIGPMHLGIAPIPAAAAGLLISCIAAYILARPILKLRGYYIAVATLALGYLLALVIVSEPSVTGGPDGMSVPRLNLFGIRIASATQWYWISATFLVVGAFLATNLKHSRSGTMFRAIHDSEAASATLGIDVARQKLRAFVISAAYGSIAGSLMALMNGFSAPGNASFLYSVELLTMVVIGGAGSVIGAIRGAALLVVLPQLLTIFNDYETAMIGLIIVLVMIFLRKGIVPTLTARWGAPS
jgi:branched-chain amino acid transport system permease protein